MWFLLIFSPFYHSCKQMHLKVSTSLCKASESLLRENPYSGLGAVEVERTSFKHVIKSFINEVGEN